MDATRTPSAATVAELTVYFDGACPVCSREIALYRGQAGAERIRWVDASDPSVDGAAALGDGLTRRAALARMHVREADGRLVSGAAAFARLWAMLPATAWLARVARWPLVLPLMEIGYRLFLRLRRLWRPGRGPRARA